MNAERIKAIVAIAVTAAVNVANVCGYAMDAELWVNAALSVASAACIAWSWWKNQNVTYAAQQGQLVVDRIKAEQKALQAREADNG